MKCSEILNEGLLSDAQGRRMVIKTLRRVKAQWDKVLRAYQNKTTNLDEDALFQAFIQQMFKQPRLAYTSDKNKNVVLAELVEISIENRLGSRFQKQPDKPSGLPYT